MFEHDQNSQPAKQQPEPASAEDKLRLGGRLKAWLVLLAMLAFVYLMAWLFGVFNI